MGAEAWEHIHKVQLAAMKEVKEKLPDPAYEMYGDRLALRSFFQKISYPRRKKDPKAQETKIKYTLFLEPYPFLTRYREGDEDFTEFNPVFYESFRLARHVYTRLLDAWYLKQRRFRKGSDLP